MKEASGNKTDWFLDFQFYLALTFHKKFQNCIFKRQIAIIKNINYFNTRESDTTSC